MKLSDLKTVYQERTKQASDINRQLCFVGIAVIWIFKVNQSGNFELDHNFKLSLLLFIGSLGLDLLQYIIAATIFFILYRAKENENKMKIEKRIARRKFQWAKQSVRFYDPDINLNYLLINPIWFLFYAKIILNIISYSYLFGVLYKAIKFT